MLAGARLVGSQLRRMKGTYRGRAPGCGGLSAWCGCNSARECGLGVVCDLGKVLYDL